MQADNPLLAGGGQHRAMADPERLTRERRLEGPGAEARHARLNARFRAASRRLPRTHSPDRTRLWLTLWLTAWASCVGASLFLLFGR